MTAAVRILATALGLLAAAATQADVFQPAYLELRELGGDRYSVLWRVPTVGSSRRLPAEVEFEAGVRRLSEPQPTLIGPAWVERFDVAVDGGLVGHTISITGIRGGVTDVIARVERLDGTSQVERLLPERPSFVVRPAEGRAEIAWAYFVLGVEHILGGIDHLLFVLALLLIVRGGRRIVATITAFTVAHSITLVAATLGWVSVPGPPVEAIIALSIVFVAAEVLHGRQGHPGLAARAPWIVAFSFGLLHGLGFAGALAEVGLPQIAIPIALLMFNVGVEAGQLIFVAAVLSAAAVARSAFGDVPARLTTTAAYAIGAIASFWTIERIVSFAA